MHECKKFLNLHYFLKMMIGFQNPIPKHALNYACLEAISVQLFLTPLVSEKQKTYLTNLLDYLILIKINKKALNE